MDHRQVHELARQGLHIHSTKDLAFSTFIVQQPDGTRQVERIHWTTPHEAQEPQEPPAASAEDREAQFWRDWLG